MDVMREYFVTGLKNAHAMEKQALSIMEPQLNRLEHYPQVLERLGEHVRETEGQIERLRQILESAGESPSAMKDGFLSAMGSMAALGHVPAQDEIMKNSLANLAFENYEIAAYTALRTIAEATGDTQAAGLLEQSLDEEKRMAAWIQENLPEITRSFLARKAEGLGAKV
ncbi:ferritin-like domain-containing protein [Rhodobacter sp. NSM]|uniref:ferritin-like domain-containing protein n=1 Tax=Rhodobacter sp. NSM TaxID=3457501 RepID=UPI003FD03E95